jgi:hypothetical protein
VYHPDRARQLLAEGRDWLVSHQRRLTATVVLVFGALLTLSGALHLLT